LPDQEDRRWIGLGRAVERGPKLPECLAKILADDVWQAIVPEDAGERFTKLWAVPMQQQIGEQLTSFDPIEPVERPIVPLNVESAQEIHPQR
jgi:hypothetical protein